MLSSFLALLSHLLFASWNAWDAWGAYPGGSGSILNSSDAPFSMEDVPKSGFSAIGCAAFSLPDCSSRCLSSPTNVPSVPPVVDRT